MLKRLIVLTPFMFLWGRLVAQQPNSSLLFKYTGGLFDGKMDGFVMKQSTWPLFMGHYLAKVNSGRDTFCLEDMSYIKFRFNKQDQLVDIACSKSTHPALTEAVKKAVKASEPYWNKEYIRHYYDNRVFVLPFYYSYYGGCPHGKEPTDAMDRNVSALNAFDDNITLDPADCLLFAPLYQSTPPGH